MRPTDPDLSVVICTYNRRQLVERAVRSLETQSLAPGRFEIVLVDNNSSDGTLGWAHEYAEAHPQLRVFHEKRQGLSFARNLGGAESRARVVAFLDDDAVATPVWAAALLEPFLSGPTGTVAVGGRIELEWSLPRPRWVPENALGYLGYFTLPMDCQMEHGVDNLRGGNMAIERKTLLELGQFDTRLGRSKKDLMGNEEIELQRRIERLGRPIVYAHDAVIYHLVHAERLRQRWFVRRAYDQGRSDVRLEKALPEIRVDSMVLSLGRTAYNAVRASLSVSPDSRVEFMMRAARSGGAFIESVRLRSERTSAA